jgi:hypothetical protein
VGNVLTLSVDGKPDQSVEVVAGDLAVNGTATVEETANILSRLSGVTVSVIEDAVSGDFSINLRTNTSGARGSIQIKASTMVGASKLDFSLKKQRITNLAQRTVIYQVRSRELIIELPAAVPIFTSSLKGSHHFHEDATLESPVAPANGTWIGSFLYEPSGEPYTVTGKKCILQQNILAGSVQPTLNVDDADNIDDEQGYLIFSWGLNQEEKPVKYLRRSNSNTLLLDPSHVFAKNHLTGTVINQLDPQLTAFRPRENGDDSAIYLPSPTAVRGLIQNMLKNLVAEGVIVKFVILLPNFKYLILNPYETENE